MAIEWLAYMQYCLRKQCQQEKTPSSTSHLILVVEECQISGQARFSKQNEQTYTSWKAVGQSFLFDQRLQKDVHYYGYGYDY